jgi:CO/xanthine dehydrogenase Mo-binding subunit
LCEPCPFAPQWHFGGEEFIKWQAEVAANVETGEVKVLRFAAAIDSSSINPKMVESQIEGGVVQGIGSSLHEEIVLEEGVVLNPSFMDYKIPTSLDIPTNESFKTMIVPIPHREGPFGAKGVGEVPVSPTAPVIANAIYDAIGARITDLPISREKVLAAVRDNKRIKHYLSCLKLFFSKLICRRCGCVWKPKEKAER